MSDTLNLARYKKGNDTFEVVVHPDKALAFRQQGGDINDVLVYPQVYTDAKKGLLAPDDKLQAAFDTTDPLEAAKRIIQKGDVQVTAEYRQQQFEQKKKRIVDLISRQGVDPRTNTPHPPSRIESAMEQAKVTIDPHKQAEQQIPKILKALQPIIPIKLVTKELQVTIPAQYAPKAYPIVKQYGKLLKENWQQDGSWQGVVEIPGGLEEDFYGKLNSLTQGNVQTTILKTKGEEA